MNRSGADAFLNAGAFAEAAGGGTGGYAGRSGI